MRDIIRLQTGSREVLIDITPQVRDLVGRSAVRDGLVSPSASLQRPCVSSRTWIGVLRPNPGVSLGGLTR